MSNIKIFFGMLRSHQEYYFCGIFLYKKYEFFNHILIIFLKANFQ
ncbi:hypothetical protein K661_02133 [Piscirickettsia salmonis LF-89 = ATCC VR-1361]|nr:hypothetical protein K661_02133 [Piscirickettsia salmonis LF-89 = ATCC VR-1361]